MGMVLLAGCSGSGQAQVAPSTGATFAGPRKPVTSTLPSTLPGWTLVGTATPGPATSTVAYQKVDDTSVMVVATRSTDDAAKVVSLRESTVVGNARCGKLLSQSTTIPVCVLELDGGLIIVTGSDVGIDVLGPVSDALYTALT